MREQGTKGPERAKGASRATGSRPSRPPRGLRRSEPPSGARRSELPAPPGRRCAVLVVESDPDHQWRLARTLTALGNRVVGTSSGDGALALVAEWSVDLAIVAEDLPGMDGLELIRRLRRRTPELAVVLLVGPHVPAPRMEGVRVCAKPLAGPVLRDVLEELSPSIKGPRAATGTDEALEAGADPSQLPLPAE